MATAGFFSSLRDRVGGLWPRWGGQGGGDPRASMLLAGTRFDHERDAGDPWSNSVVSIGMNWLGDRFPRPPMRVSRIGPDGKYEPLPRHPLIDLWSRPNPWHTRRDLETALALSVLSDGNGLAQRVRDKGGRLAELWWIPHNTAVPLWPSDGSVFLSDWQITVDGTLYTVPVADVLHFRKGIDPRNVRLGLGQLKALGRELGIVNEEATFTAGLMRNSAVPGLMIVPEDAALRPSKADAERIKGTISDEYSGDKVGGTVVLAGKYRVTPVGFSPEQLRLDKLPQLAMAKLAAGLGVPLMAMGLPDPGKTYSNIESALRIGWGAVMGLQDLIAERLRWDLLPDFGTDPYTHIVEYDYGDIAELQESLDAVHGRARDDYQKGLITLNEARDLIGQAPTPDGDRFFAPGSGKSPDAAMLGQAPTEQESDVLKMVAEALREFKGRRDGAQAA